MAHTAAREGEQGIKPRRGSAHDPAEHEADALARLLVTPHAASPTHCTACAGGEAPCPACARAARSLPGGEPRAQSAPATHHIGSGAALPEHVHTRFARRLGGDVPPVRIHTGTGADRAVRNVGARAFALGTDIAFADGQYRPDTTAGLHLLAHEVAHVALGHEGLRRDDDAALASLPEAPVCEALPASGGTSRISDPATTTHGADYDPCRVDVRSLTNYDLLAEYANALRVVHAGRGAAGYFDYRNLQRRLIGERDRRVELGHAWLAEMPSGLPEQIYQIVDGPGGSFSVVASPGNVVAGAPEGGSAAPCMTWAQFERFLQTHNVERIDANTYLLRRATTQPVVEDEPGAALMPPFAFPSLWRAPPLPLVTLPAGPVAWPALPPDFHQPGPWRAQPRAMQIDLLANPPAMNPRLTREMIEAISAYRRMPGVPVRIDPIGSAAAVEGGTVAIATTDIPNLGPARFPGASAQALPPTLRGTPGTTGGQILVPANPIATNHAEHVALENLRLAIETALAEGRITRADLRGRTVHVMVEQEPCASCAAGVASSEGRIGVLQQFARLYPELTVEVRSMRDSRALIYRSGTLLNPSRGPAPALPIEVATPSRPSADSFLTPEYLQTLRQGGGGGGEMRAMAASGIRGAGVGTLVVVATQAGVMMFDSRDHPDWALELGVGGGLGLGSGLVGSASHQIIASRLTSSMLREVVATGGSRITPGLASGAGRLGGGAAGAIFIEGISMGLLEEREHSGLEVGTRITRAGALGAGSVWAGAAAGTAVGGPIGFIVGLAVGGLLYYIGDRAVPGGREDWDAYEAGCQPRARQRDADDWPRAYHCFEAGTPITLASGESAPISTIAVGSEVLSWDEGAARTRACRVTAVHRAPPQHMVRIDCEDGRSLRATGVHKLMTDTGWRAAGRLLIGDTLHCLDNGALGGARINAIAFEEGGSEVFDLSVEETHTYFAAGVLAHNKFI